MTNSQNFPSSWVLSSLGDVTTRPQYGWTTKATDSGENLKLLRTSDISSGRVNWQTVPTCVKEPAEPEKYFLNAGDIVVARAGSVGKSFLIREDVTDAIFASYLVRFTPRISSKYIDLFMQSRRYWEQIEDKSSGIAIPNVNASKLSQVEIPIAPLNEQRRIVEKIETLFARLDQGEAALRQVQKLLIRYRQSVLKAAVTGQLTADWRAQNAHRLEHGRDLLERILQIRRENWQGRGQYKEPAAPDTTDLPELPEGWVWVSFEQIFSVYGGATPSRRTLTNWDGDIPWVSSGEVAFCRINETREHLSLVGYDSCSTKLHPVGTVLLAMIGEGKTRGQAAILDTPACNNQNVAAIRVSESGLSPEYVYYFLMGRYEQSRKEGQGGNQPALNGGKVKTFIMPLPSYEEMQEIVAWIDRAFSMSVAIETAYQTELTRSAALRQSILKEAFAGRLVPQDLNDEPAAELLARIRAERVAEKPQRRSCKRASA